LKGVVLGPGSESERERVADRQTFRQVDYVSAHFAGTN
jgi:hypothetical protein